MIFIIDKEYKLRCGYKAVVKYVMPEPNRSEYPVAGIYWDGEYWKSATWNLDGRFHISCCNDLDILAPKTYVYAACYRTSYGGYRDSYKDMLEKMSGDHIGCYLRVETAADGSYKWETIETIKIGEGEL